MRRHGNLPEVVSTVTITQMLKRSTRRDVFPCGAMVNDHMRSISNGE